MVEIELTIMSEERLQEEMENHLEHVIAKEQVHDVPEREKLLITAVIDVKIDADQGHVYSK